MIGLVVILVLTAYFRFSFGNWDDNHHLHPDERFLTMVATAMKLPTTVGEYLDPARSFANPANIDFAFFVYGTWPIMLTKAVAIAWHQNTYDHLTLVGRTLSATADTVTALITMLTALYLAKKLKSELSPTFGIWTGFFYLTFVLPIQLSHFFTTDPWLTLCMTASLSAAIVSTFNRHWIWIVISGLTWGLSLGTKVSGVYLAPILSILFFWQSIGLKFHSALTPSLKSRVLNILGFLGLRICLMGIMAYFALRLSAPYYFSSGSPLNPLLHPQFISSLSTLKQFDSPSSWYPPTIQWIGTKPILFSLLNTSFYGLGIPTFLILVAGSFLIMKFGSWRFRWLIVWVWSFFIFQSVQFTKALRYTYFLYPWFAMICAYAVTSLIKRLPVKNPRTIFLKVVIIICCSIWPLMFWAIYQQPHSRIKASTWIYQNIPTNSVIATEYWDDGLPLAIGQLTPQKYIFQELAVFEPDTAEKWLKINQQLGETDYLILSSNRGWGSITKVPAKYPVMAQFYRELLAGQSHFKKIAEFSSFPALNYLGIHISLDDSGADETFTVYDHPVVMIFENTSRKSK